MKITFIGFNFGSTRAFTNGPGMSFYNFLSAVSNRISISIFTAIPVEQKIKGIKYYTINEKDKLRYHISDSDYVHHWSGIDKRFVDALKMANRFGKRIISGPNVLDTVQLKKEKTYLEAINPDLFLTVNERLKYTIAKIHDIPVSIISSFVVGPDLEAWSPSEDSSKIILWKGNCTHKVKDVEFGLKLRTLMPQYKFLFLGYPAPYDYLKHIPVAKSAKLYINTSLSETKSQALLESWAAGVPSITHPKVYMHGENYRTGIIVGKSLEEYREAIIEVMENNVLHKNLSAGAISFSQENFSKKVIMNKYFHLLDGIK
jgi:glycosyltransferase involved in cell wall biosynthesis